MRLATIVKKMGVPFLGILLFVSCGSDDSEIARSGSGLSQEEKNYKKELILAKFKELGLNPANVSFTDEIKSDDCIMLKSLDDLEKIFPKEPLLSDNDVSAMLDAAWLEYQIKNTK